MTKRPRKSSKVAGSVSQSRSLARTSSATVPSKADFDVVLSLIDSARTRAMTAVNTTLIELYWSIGEFISRKIESAAWGEGVVNQLAGYIAETQPGLRGFTRSNLLRMRQFYETYQGSAIVAPLVRQLPWTHNLLILSKSKRPEEREFYLRMSASEKWSKRELERQINGALFERVVLSPTIVSPPLTQLHPDAASVFKDSYLIEFLGLPQIHSEDDLHRGLVEQLKNFLIELGRDFCFVGSHFPVQVGGRDFELDLLFFNRALNCLVALELKVVEFEPEHLGKLQFYLEALDRDVKKPHEQPSIGVLLCATKNHEVVEYALSRSVSPALVAQYQTRLPDKKLLQAKLHEFYRLAQEQAELVSPPVARLKLPKKSASKKPQVRHRKSKESRRK
jgi:predicted nuclease of restriction endonuclease-like (RecB) superfamily